MPGANGKRKNEKLRERKRAGQTAADHRRIVAAVKHDDRDDDGVVQKSDYEALAEHVIEAKGYGPGSPGRERAQRLFNRGFDLYRRSDADNDGKVSLEEAADAVLGASVEELEEISLLWFDVADSDEDGRISLSDYVNMFPSDHTSPDELQQRFTTLDTDGDGFVSRNEWLALTDSFFLEDDKTPGKAIWAG